MYTASVVLALVTAAAAWPHDTLFNDFAYPNRACYECLHKAEFTCAEGDGFVDCFCPVPGARWSEIEQCLNSSFCQERNEAAYTLGGFGQFCVLRNEEYFHDYCDPAKRAADPLVEQLGHIICPRDYVWKPKPVSTSTTTSETSSATSTTSADTTTGTSTATETTTSTTTATSTTSASSSSVPSITSTMQPTGKLTTTLTPTASFTNGTTTVNCTTSTTAKTEDCSTLTTTTVKTVECKSCSTAAPVTTIPCAKCPGGVTTVVTVPTAPVVVTGGAAALMTGASGLAAVAVAALLL